MWPHEIEQEFGPFQQAGKSLIEMVSRENPQLLARLFEQVKSSEVDPEKRNGMLVNLLRKEPDYSSLRKCPSCTALIREDELRCQPCYRWLRWYTPEDDRAQVEAGFSL